MPPPEADKLIVGVAHVIDDVPLLLVIPGVGDEDTLMVTIVDRVPVHVFEPFPIA